MKCVNCTKYKWDEEEQTTRCFGDCENCKHNDECKAEKHYQDCKNNNCKYEE